MFSDAQATLQIHFERRLTGGWLLTQDGGSSMVSTESVSAYLTAFFVCLQLTENEVDCWTLDQDELKQMEEEELYPPRFVVKVNGHQATDQATAFIRFTGVQGHLETELSLEPFSYHQTRGKIATHCFVFHCIPYSSSSYKRFSANNSWI